MYRIAVASSDGSCIDQPLGCADCFYIAEVDAEGAFEFTEVRVANYTIEGNICSKCLSNELELTLISDCSYVLAKQAGLKAARLLASLGISVLYADGDALEAVERVVNAPSKRHAKTI
jgi:predicted Fe-Mo cluster-binding NifX family protein